MITLSLYLYVTYNELVNDLLLGGTIMDFREFSQSKIEPKQQKIDDDFEKKLEEETKKTMNKYANYSQTELVDEFLHIARMQMANGELSYEKLDKIYQTLLPYLNDEQKNLFKDLKNKI